jgi:hypothetical protein
MVKDIESNKVFEVQVKIINEVFKQNLQNVQKINNQPKPYQYNVKMPNENEDDCIHQNFQIE